MVCGLWVRSTRAVRASDFRRQRLNIPGFNPTILGYSGIRGAAVEVMKNEVLIKSPKSPPFCCLWNIQ
jgi:hypothetical protein